jgi:hypothetical protein
VAAGDFRDEAVLHEAMARVAAFGASSPLRRVPAKVS